MKGSKRELRLGGMAACAKTNGLRRRVTALVRAAGIALLATGAPALAVQVTDDRGLGFGEMVETEKACAFLLSPGLSKLIDLQDADYSAYDPIFQSLSDNVHGWLNMRMEMLGQGGVYAVFPSPETKVELQARFRQCVESNAGNAAVEKILRALYPSYLQNMAVELTRPYFGGGRVALETLVFMGSLTDGSAALDAFLHYVGSLSDAGLKKVALQSPPVTDTPLAPENEADAVFGQMTTTEEEYVGYRCRLSGNAILGLQVIVGREIFADIELLIYDDGRARVNGAWIAALGTKPDDAGALAGAYYNAMDVYYALTPVSSNPGIPNLSRDQLEAFKLMQQLTRQNVLAAMGDRRRYMLFSVQQPPIRSSTSRRTTKRRL